MASTPFRRLCHWAPITVLCIIKLITWAMVHLLGMWWPPHKSIWAALHAMTFLGFAASTLYFFLLSLLEGPGYVPLSWKPEREEDQQYLQFCTVCKGYKPPRAHHCRKCGYCIMKMDHHCPWINSCVGHANHAHFNLFLLCAVLGCLQATIVLTICMYHAINLVWYKYNGTGREPMIYLTMTTLPLTLLAIGMALGVVLAVGTLLYFQMKGILRNQTTIEDWIVEKAACRREEQGLRPLVFPYDLGTSTNVRLILRGGGDGINWPLREGCRKYDLTREQIAQKVDKAARSRLFTATDMYSGRWVPLLQYPRAACAAPCTDEPRLPLRPGDTLRATRQRKHWLFGEKQTGGGDSTRGPRGWFPRAAVAPADSREKNKPD